MVIFTLINGKLNGKTLLYALYCRARRQCTVGFAQMVAIFYIETFVTFDFDPSLSSRLITVSDAFYAINWWIIVLQNSIVENAEIFDLSPKK